ncbi:hypothetical protein [Novosphingobium sp. SCN 63-17]|nr:hypothetical protein [Novosphingobium sp. SCN 63-17]
MAYHYPDAAQYDERYRSRVISNLQRRAKACGIALKELPEEQEMTVS